ncbi:hypothetical protein QR680_002834 [Steinernema hermaphroditum]|uniref:Uncharacterized protein n=1 Tax=Steinernema hermaphroditum TaxID=289476 RepID=A0AA39H495_9BILA|nr:hypothetical protein QR680_002834 [Steinernema hermaphroditum]
MNKMKQLVEHHAVTEGDTARVAWMETAPTTATRRGRLQRHWNKIPAGKRRSKQETSSAISILKCDIRLINPVARMLQPPKKEENPKRCRLKRKRKKDSLESFFTFFRKRSANRKRPETVATKCLRIRLKKPSNADLPSSPRAVRCLAVVEKEKEKKIMKRKGNHDGFKPDGAAQGKLVCKERCRLSDRKAVFHIGILIPMSYVNVRQPSDSNVPHGPRLGTIKKKPKNAKKSRDSEEKDGATERTSCKAKSFCCKPAIAMRSTVVSRSTRNRNRISCAMLHRIPIRKFDQQNSNVYYSAISISHCLPVRPIFRHCVGR